jgi:bacterioferritin-associated ferredoxin
MYVCICHAVTDQEIRSAVERGAVSLFDVQRELPVGCGCGRCQETASAIVDEHLQHLEGGRAGAAKKAA